MRASSELASLTSLDLDVEELEKRIEMSSLLHPIPVYSCLVACEQHGSKPAPQ